ncbi:glycosyltransferase [Heliobacterium gestii]|uniref:Glycosyltransferase n=1 Tax=Heliomicrobium gestii TaxID=2699 RepID=A0A845LDV2_HELGE|nr:glycosyltransferase [Heliomicrobium gestii]MBM7866610.1 glycosyltransferase involved in cell wall biosynthesis/uncharacterized coiled-coil protein SlyX [Heliomicrobium gestii]MZP43110.1 glycosyltransferase [Heliomicrobium gestii]
MIRDLKVGIPIIGGKGWLGGVSYIELLVRAVALLSEDERPQVLLIVRDDQREDFSLHLSFLSYFDGIALVGARKEDMGFEHSRIMQFSSESELYVYLDFIFPVNLDVLSDVCSASWIPDFQHQELPEFFSVTERLQRDQAIQKIAKLARLIVFSSRSSQAIFHRCFPQSAAETRVLSFYTIPKGEWYQTDPVYVQKRYGLPERFLICCNQFWLHKNHSTLMEAIAILQARGVEVQLVCTGATNDYRTADYMPTLKRYINRLNISHRVHILGTVPREDQIQLIRRSMAVVQPSLYEGWSTVVEDCRALGKRMILSELDVHREQNPAYSAFFSPMDATELADKIGFALEKGEPGPDLQREQEARTWGNERALMYARQFCQIVRDAQAIFKEHKRIVSLKSKKVALWDVEKVSLTDGLSIPELFQQAREDLIGEAAYWLQVILQYCRRQSSVMVVNSGHGALVALLNYAGFTAVGLETRKWYGKISNLIFDIPVLPDDREAEQAAFDILVVLDGPSAFDIEAVLTSVRKGGLVLVQVPAGQARIGELDMMIQLLEENGFIHFQRREQEHWSSILIASSQSISPVLDAELRERVAEAPLERLLLGLMDAFPLKGMLQRQYADNFRLESRLAESEADRMARLCAIKKLEQRLNDSEADRTARLHSIEELEQRLRECEADRNARLEIINHLNEQLIASEKDRANRLKAIDEISRLLRESEEDRAARLQVIHELERRLVECEADRAARLKVIHELERKLSDITR